MPDRSFQRQLRAVALERARRIRGLWASRAPAQRDEALREAHTLKGEARITGRADVATLAHDLETAIEADDDDAVEPLLDALEAAVGAPAEATSERAPSLEHALLRIELWQVSELTRACSELRVVQRSSERLAHDLASLAASTDPVKERARRLRTLSRRARELAFEQDQRTGVLERDLRDLRMLPIARLFEPLALAARQLASDLDKALNVVVEGGGAAVDRQVLDTMSEPLLHLVRNAVDHGIESIGERVELGKSVVGTIRLSATETGREVRLAVEDDGAGIDLDAVRRALVVRGGWTEDAALGADRDAVLAQLFEPAFTTRAEASEVSGRGLGLDIVRRRAEALGGSVGLETAAGAGTRFVVTVPVSLVADPVVPVEVDGLVYALATSEVTAMTERSSVRAGRAGDAALVRLEDATLPLADLGELVGAIRRGAREAVVAIRADGGELALAVDRVLPVTAAVREGLDPFLEGTPLVRGTVSIEGRLVTLLDGRELVRRARRALPSAPPPSAARTPVAARVLVVDDSALTRDVLIGALEALGCRVTEAVDGAQALERLGAGRFDLVLTDIDMPVMDGLELLARIRAAPRTERLPVIVLTTRTDRASLDRAAALGADAHLAKTAFRTEELAQLVRTHVGGAS